MSVGSPDWSRATTSVPVATVKSAYIREETVYDSPAHGIVSYLIAPVEKNIGGREVWVYSFSGRAWQVATCMAARTHAYLGEILVWCSFYDPNGNEVARVMELQTPILIKNVDKIEIYILYPGDSVGDSSNIEYLHTYGMAAIAYLVR